LMITYYIIKCDERFVERQSRRVVAELPWWFLPGNVCNMLVSERASYAVALYSLCMGMLVVYKPSPLFNKQTIQPFGAGPGKTLMSLGTVSSVLAVTSMATFTMVDMLNL
jgi:hypothetical protein